MASWYLQILGTPQLAALHAEKREPEHEEVVRFRYRETWLLLTSLALDPQITQREALIHRLGFESKKSVKEALRFRLHDLRHGATSRKSADPAFCGIGEENLLSNGDMVALAPGVVVTDLQKLEAILEEARLLPTAQERIACLKRGALLLRGPLLDGFDASLYPGHWLETLRFRADRLAAELWLLLAQELDSNSERRSAFDAARKAYSLSPENPETLELLLGLAEGTRERDEVLLLSKQLGVEGLFSRLEDLEKEGQSLTVSEEHALLEAIKVRLAQLSQKASSGLKLLACFPQDFTTEQAEVIAGVAEETLTRLVKAFPLRRRAERYYLLPALRGVLKGMLSEQQRAHFSQSHAHYFQGLLELGPRGTANDAVQCQLFTDESSHLIAALEWFQSQPPTQEGVFLHQSCWLWLGELVPVRNAIFQAASYLETAVDTLATLGGKEAGELLGMTAMAQQDFKRALFWYRLTLERFNPLDQHIWLLILQSAHHGAEDEVFDYYANLILTQWPIPNLMMLPQQQRSLVQEDVYRTVAENRMARRRFLEALEHNEKAFFFRRETRLGEDSSPSLWGQRASILDGLGRFEESEQCWDRALRGYEIQGNWGGVAECYQALGKLAARRRQFGLGLSLLRQAIGLFEGQGNWGAVAAAQGILGDIRLDLGEREEARALYEQGLAYWQKQNHSRWTQMFQNRLVALEVVSADSIDPA